MSEPQPAVTTPPDDRERSRAPLVILALVIVGGALGAGGWAFWGGPRDHLEMTSLQDGPLRTKVFRISHLRKDRQSPEVYLTPEVWRSGSGFGTRPDETYWLEWQGVGPGFEYRTELREDGTLILTPSGEGGRLRVSQDEILLLTTMGPTVLRGAEVERLLPVLANPRIYHGAQLVNSVPKDSAAVNELGLPAGIEVRVVGVSPGSPAEAAGLRAGDVLEEVSLGGRAPVAITSRESFATWLCGITSGNTLSFKVRRGEETRLVDVKTRERKLLEFCEPDSVSDDASLFERH